MPWWTWIALGLFAVTALAGGIFAAFAFGRLRRLRAQGEALARTLDEVSQRADELERRAEHASKRAEDVSRAQARLEGSLERLSVLSWALGDARRGISRLRGAYLRK